MPPHLITIIVNFLDKGDHIKYYGIFFSNLSCFLEKYDILDDGEYTAEYFHPDLKIKKEATYEIFWDNKKIETKLHYTIEEIFSLK